MELLDDKVVSWEIVFGDKFEVFVVELKNGYMCEQDYCYKMQNFVVECEQVMKVI